MLVGTGIAGARWRLDPCLPHEVITDDGGLGDGRSTPQDSGANARNCATPTMPYGSKFMRGRSINTNRASSVNLGLMVEAPCA